MEIQITLSPDAIARELNEGIEDATERFFSSLKTELAPAAREVTDSSSPSGRLYARRGGEGFKRFHRASATGQPPAKDTFELYNSFRAELEGNRTIRFEMAEHAKFLDPVFGGYLDRPFIESAVELAVRHSIAKSL